MCLLALFYRVAEDAPIVVGANREEEYARDGTPPQRLEGAIAAAAGLDPTAGGTWLGVNARGLLVATTNRKKSGEPTQPRSRGLLVRDLLGLATAQAAADEARRALAEGSYRGCNILCADAESAVVVHAGDWLRVRPLPPGLHVLSNGDVNEDGDRRARYAAEWLGQFSYRTADDCLAALRQLCAKTGTDDARICFRDEERGTVSSSLIAIRARTEASVYWHAQGPPDRTPYKDYSALLGPRDVGRQGG
jgi:uncharacterized protein with NRDE domain